MLKRPSDNSNANPAKKPRYAEKLDAMKVTIERMMLKATEEQETLRIAAIDNATELEEKWQSCMGIDSNNEKELVSLTAEYETARTYFSQFVTSSTYRMLEKASKCELETIRPLGKHREQINQSLEQLNDLYNTLETQKNSMVKQREISKKAMEDAYEKFKQAETNVEVITELN